MGPGNKIVVVIAQMLLENTHSVNLVRNSEVSQMSPKTGGLERCLVFLGEEE